MEKQLNHLIHTFLTVTIIELILFLYSILPETSGKNHSSAYPCSMFLFDFNKTQEFLNVSGLYLYSIGLHISWAAEALKKNPLAIYSLYKSPADAVYNTPLNSWLSFTKLRRELVASARLLCTPKGISIWLRLLLYSPGLNRVSRSSFLFFFSSVLQFFLFSVQATGIKYLARNEQKKNLHSGNI